MDEVRCELREAQIARRVQRANMRLAVTPFLCSLSFFLMAHPAMARGGGQCGATCGGIFIGIAGVAVVIALVAFIDGAWRYDKLKAKTPTMMPRRNYVALTAFVSIAIIAFGYFIPGTFFTVVILTVLVGCAIAGVSWLVSSGDRRRR
jgi:hypothetical protein